MESDPQANAKLQPVSTWLRPLYLSAYAAFVLLLFGVLPPLAGGLPGAELLYGALGDPQLAARSSALAAPFLALGLWLAAPITVLGRALLLVLIAAAVFWLGPYITAIPAGLTLRCCWAAVLLVPLLFARNPGPKARSQTFVPLVSGIAVALSMYVLSDRLHHFGYGEAYETHTRAIVLLLLAALGAVAFALPILGANRRQAGADDDPSEAADDDDSSADTASKSSERLALHVATVGAVIAVLGAVLGLNTLFPLTSKIGLAEYLQHFGLDMSELGRLSATSLIAGRGLIGLAFGLGISIAAWPSRGHLALFVLGLGVGRLYVPKLFAHITPEPIPIGSFDTALPPLLEIALGVAVLAALWMALVWIRQGRHIWKAMLRVSLGALAFLLPRTSLGTDAIPLSPWRPLETQAAYAIDSPFGLITAESHPSGQNLLVINGLTMTPPPDLANDDALALRAALDLVEANWQTGDPNPRVLLAGQLTQTRLDTFWAWRADTGREAELLWTVPWEAHLAALTDVLPGTWPLAPLPFEEAQAQIGRGHFDLVVLPLALGRAMNGLSSQQPPRASGGLVGMPYRGAGADQPAIAWMASSANLASASLSERILFSGTNLEVLAVGTLQGLPNLADTWWEHAGPRHSTPSIWSLGSPRPQFRQRAQRAELFERLAEPGDAFNQAIATLMQKQVSSSPWETPLDRIELDAADLSALAAATKTPPTAFQRLIWEQMASILVQKRMPGEALAVLPGLLEANGRWPSVEYSLGRTYLEMLMAEEGAMLLDRLFAEGYLTERGVLALVEYGDTLGQIGRFEDALAAFEVAGTLAPGEAQIQRRIATYGVRVGRAGAVQQVQALVDADPDDEELRAYLGSGPYPAPETGYDPTPLASDHADH